jgi:hypothetical protein
MIINYKDISLRNIGEKTIPDNLEFNTQLDRIDLDYILGVVEHAYGSRVQQIHRLTYKRSYPNYIDRMYPYSSNFKFPNFILFNGQGIIFVLEHIARFICQCREAANSKFLKSRFFPNSLTGSAFTWYKSLLPNSIQSWNDM